MIKEAGRPTRLVSLGKFAPRKKSLTLADVEGGSWFPARCDEIPVDDHPAYVVRALPA